MSDKGSNDSSKGKSCMFGKIKGMFSKKNTTQDQCCTEGTCCSKEDKIDAVIDQPVATQDKCCPDCPTEDQTDEIKK